LKSEDVTPNVIFRSFGISTFETEVIYDSLSSVFSVREEVGTLDPNSNYVSFVEIQFPVPFGDTFFQLIGSDKWNRIKGVLKEMKRRRGRKGLKIRLSFCGVSVDPNLEIVFSIVSGKGSEFDNAMEKIEYLGDIIPFQIQNLLGTANKIMCVYDESSNKWMAHVSD
jgi:hypothetical protein